MGEPCGNDEDLLQPRSFTGLDRLSPTLTPCSKAGGVGD